LHNKNKECLNKLAQITEQDFVYFYFTGVIYHEEKVYKYAKQNYLCAVEKKENIGIYTELYLDCLLRLSQIQLLSYFNEKEINKVKFSEINFYILTAKDIAFKYKLLNYRLAPILSCYYAINEKYEESKRNYNLINKSFFYYDLRWIINVIGLHFIRFNDINFAKTVFLFAEQINSDSSYVQNNLGAVYLQLGEYYLAKDKFSSALSIDPYYRTASENMAKVNNLLRIHGSNAAIK